MKSIIKISFIFIIMIFVLLGICYAVTESELEDEISNIDSAIDTTNTEIAGIEDEMSNELKQINRLNIQISEYENDIKDVEEEIETANDKLNEKKDELDEITEVYNEQKALVETRLVAMYETSKTTYLDILVGSNDLSDFLSKYYLLQEIADADNEMISSIYELKDEVEKETKELETEAENVQILKDSLVAKSGSLEVLIKDKSNLIDSLSEEELDLEIKLQQYEDDKKEIEEELEELARQNAYKASLEPSEAGYISPLLGKTSKSITTGYYGYSGHTGVDFAVESRNGSFSC